MWEVLPIHRIMVVGVRNDDGFDVTVFIFDRFSYNVSRAAFFRTDVEKDMRAAIANRFKDSCWDLSGPPSDSD